MSAINEREVFTRASELPADADREKYLDEACGEDAELRERIEGLLWERAELGDFLERPVLEPAPTIASEELAACGADNVDVTATEIDPEPGDAPEASLDFLVPSKDPNSLGRLGPYEISEVIGRGGMGVVLKGHDARLNRVVAINVLSSALASDPMARKRFLREARAVASISHPHVITIHAVAGNGDPPYLVMEFVDGASLQQKLNRDGALPLVEIVRVGAQVASGLAAAHELGLIHRDVKPSNILLENGVARVKITDFGLARAVDDVGMTRTGEVAGTPQYMSPEQAQSRHVDQRTDLFSLGCVLYAMCTGRSPFRADSTPAAMRRVCDDRPRAVRDVNPDIPVWLVNLIDRLLAKHPRKRAPSARGVAAELQRRLAELQFPTLAHRAARTERWAGLFRRWPRALVATSMLLLVLMTLGVTEATGVTQVSEFVATVLRIRTPEGTLVVAVDDPEVGVVIEGDGGVLITGAGPQEVRLEPGDYQIRATKDGEPVPLDRDLVTISQGGRQVVEVRPEAPVASSERALSQVERGAFVLLGGAGVAERKFDALTEALRRASDGDTIEIRSNGPIVTEPLIVRGRALTIRAGEGFRPVLRLDPQRSREFATILWSDSSLTLEGLEYWRLDPTAWRIGLGIPSPKLVDSHGAIQVAHCRFVLRTQGHAIALHDAPVSRIRNTQFISCSNTHWMGGVSWDPTTGGRLVMDNCVKAGGGTGVNLWLHRPDQKDATLQLSRNSIAGDTAVLLNLHCLPEGDFLNDQAELPGFRIESTSNLFCPREAVLRFDQAPGFLNEVERPLDLSAAASLLPRMLSWHEENSLYSPVGSDVLSFSVRGQLKQHHAPLVRLADWHAFWKQQNTNSVEGAVRFQGGDVIQATLATAERLTAEDFRLHSDSAGYRSGPDGNDLGANVDLVGPGEAYERWKRTPEYRQWQIDTGQTPTIELAQPQLGPWIERGRFFARRGHWRAAIDHYNRVIDLRPLDKEWEEYACLLLLVNDRSEYAAHCRKMEERFGDVETLYGLHLLVQSCTAGEQPPIAPERMIAWGDAAVSMERHPVYVQELAAAHLRAEDPERARELLDEAQHELDFEQATNRFLLALTHHELGDSDLGEEWYQAGLRAFLPKIPVGRGQPTTARFLSAYLYQQVLYREAMRQFEPEKWQRLYGRGEQSEQAGSD